MSASCIASTVFDWMARINPAAALTFATREYSLIEALNEKHADSEEKHSRLLHACEAMLLATGGSEYWTGESHRALKQIEDAVRFSTGHGITDCNYSPINL